MIPKRIKECNLCGEQFDETRVYGWFCPLVDCNGKLFIEYKKNKP